jgi:alpha-L-fucosidase
MLKTKPTPGDTGWFVHDRFGMFIHWGLYALAARHEWVQHREEIPAEEYDKYFRHFDPDLYDPDLWAQAAAGAGMKYFIVTSKHHEGFCLWDTKLGDYKAPNTPAGRELLAPMVEAFRGRGLRAGFYHSLIDWHHEQYVIDPHIGPYRNRADRDEMNKARDQGAYAKYLHGQVRELLSTFSPDLLWLDFSYPKDDGTGKGKEDWQSEKLYEMIRRLAPDIVLNDRMDLPEGWDVVTPEQYQPRQWVRVDGVPVVWEACQTFSGSWGYHRDEASWKSVGQLVRMLIDTVSKGGNLLLNVGPTARGEFDSRALGRLAGIGEWMKRHSRSIYGCTQAPEDLRPPSDCRLTYNPQANRLYAHVFAWPSGELHLDGMGGMVEYAQFLNDASEVPFRTSSLRGGRLEDGLRADTLTLALPVQKPDATVPVVELFLK